MQLLLDTHIIIWALSDPDKLSDKAQQEIKKASQLFVSAASIWEISIKSDLGKLEIDLDEFTSTLLSMNVMPLAISWEHTKQVKTLPHYHRDPFDRLLIAQAICEPLILLTHDKILAEYTDLVHLV